MAQYLSTLAMTPALKPAIQNFSDCIEKQKQREDGQLELAADFCGLFLSTPKTGALPYASIYLDPEGLLNGKPAQAMMTWLETYDVAQRKDFNEPADHLAIILDFLGNLIVFSNQAEDEDKTEDLMQAQLRLIDEMIQPWFSQFQAKLTQWDQFGFYQSAAKLLGDFIKLDRAFLKGE